MTLPDIANPTELREGSVFIAASVRWHLQTIITYSHVPVGHVTSIP